MLRADYFRRWQVQSVLCQPQMRKFVIQSDISDEYLVSLRS